MFVSVSRLKTGRATDVEYIVVEGKIQAARPSHWYAIAIANVKLPKTVTVKPAAYVSHGYTFLVQSSFFCNLKHNGNIII
jgi:hypothetical protein